MENGLELRESRKALEKADQSPERPSVSESDDEVRDSSFLSNSDLYDADSGDEDSKLGCPREKLTRFLKYDFAEFLKISQSKAVLAY